MRIIIDLQGVQTESRYRGIGRYTLSLTQALLTANRNHEIILLLNGLLLSENDPLVALLEQWLLPSYIKTWYAPDPVSYSDPNNKQRAEHAELIREAYIQSLQPDVVLIPSFFEGFIDDAVISIKRWDQHTPVAVCMLDLIPLLNAKEYLDPNPLYKAFYLSRTEQLRQADSFLAISESSKQEAEQHLVTHHQPVINASIAADSMFIDQQLTFAEQHIIRQQLGINTQFILYTGGADTRKNLPALIQAYALLPDELRRDYVLVIAGRIPPAIVIQLHAVMSAQQLRSEDVLFMGYVSDQELVSLYNTCQLFVFPSWHEGFGLPALEAIRCGAPTLVANRSSLPEVVGSNDALFDPFNPEDLAVSMQRVLTDNEFRQQLCAQQKQHSTVFDWVHTAKLTLQALESLASDAVDSATKLLTADEIKQQLLDRLLAEPMAAEQHQRLTECISKTFTPPQQHTLWVDISELYRHDARTGIQRVTRSLLQQLLRSPPIGFKTIPVYGSTDTQGYAVAKTFLPEQYKSSVTALPSGLISHQAGDIFLGLDLQHHVSLAQAPYLQNMQTKGVHIHFIVYDLLPINLSHTFPTGVAELHATWLRHIVSFGQVLCISKAVSQELKDWLKQQHITTSAAPSWFHLGADIQSSQPSRGLPDNHLSLLEQWRATPSFINVGTLEPRKGQAQALDAFELLWAKGYSANLILIGKQGWQTEQLAQRIEQHPQLNQKLFWLNNASDEFLEQIYSVCSALLATSLGEGFGLPLLEARSHQVAIIARDLPVFREVLDNHGYYFSGQHGNDLAIVIEQYLHTPAAKQVDQPPIPTLTWQGSAQQLLTRLMTRNTTVTAAQLNAMGTPYSLNDTYLSIKKNLRRVLLTLDEQAVNYPLTHQLLEQALLDFDTCIQHNQNLEQQSQQHTAQCSESSSDIQQQSLQLQMARQAEQQLHQQLYLTLNSHSWKLTAPVRLLSTHAKVWLPKVRALTRRLMRN